MTRKLPSPDKLYDLIMIKGESYSTLAMRYKVARSVVAHAFRRDCLAAGIEWPVERKRGDRISKGLRAITVDAGLIADMVREHMHDHKLSQKELARRTGVSQATFSNLLSGKEDRMQYNTVKKLMSALNEDVPPAIQEWHPIRFNKAYQNNSAPKQKNAEHVLDDWAFLRSCGWTSAERIADKIGMTPTALRRMLERHRDDPRVGSLKWVFVDDSVVPLV